MDDLTTVKYLDLNTSGRDFVVGDLHGCYDELMKLLDYISFDKTKDRLISVGDLIDRGKKNIQCLQLTEKPWFHATLGNHEHMLWRASKFSDMHMYNVWLNNGGDWALEINDMWMALDVMCDHYISKMPLVIVVGKDTPQRYNVVHAEFNRADSSKSQTVSDHDIDTWNFDEDDIYNMIWGRTVITRGPGRTIHQKDLSPTYSGHTPQRQLCVASSQYFIDTGCVFAVRNNTGSQRVGLTIVEPNAKKFYTWASGEIFATNDLPDLGQYIDQQLCDDPWKDILPLNDDF